MWIDILKLVVGAVIAGLAAYIAYQQFQVARTKLRLDLYEKRYKVYTALQQFILKALQKVKVKEEDFFILHAEIAEAKFLFGPDVVDYITLVRRKVSTYQGLRDRMYGGEPLEVGDARNKVVAEEAAIYKWLDQQQTDGAPEVFKPYLDFRAIRG